MPAITNFRLVPLFDSRIENKAQTAATTGYDPGQAPGAAENEMFLEQNATGKGGSMSYELVKADNTVVVTSNAVLGESHTLYLYCNAGVTPGSSPVQKAGRYIPSQALTIDSTFHNAVITCRWHGNLDSIRLQSGGGGNYPGDTMLSNFIYFCAVTGTAELKVKVEIEYTA